MNCLVEDWALSGSYMETPAGRVFTQDFAAMEPDGSPPLFIIHGFPTCSFDFRQVVPALRRNRRVILFDQIGFGLSDKPDRRYGIHLHADTALRVAEHFDLGSIDLLTHDMGDSVGGELLARDMEGELGVSIRRTVISNGSIYLDLAHLTPGQQLLNALPDETTDPIPVENFSAGVAATFAPDSVPDPRELEAIGELGAANGGLTLMARLIRYLDDRRREEERYTGAIESHPAPLSVIWGRLDPVADVAMTDRLSSRRPSATLNVLDTVGHYPMIEAPEAFAAAVLEALG